MPNYCIVDGCDKHAGLGDPKTGKRTHCAAHGKPLGLVDVVSKRCAVDGCDTFAKFGDPETGKATHCAASKPSVSSTSHTKGVRSMDNTPEIR